MSRASTVAAACLIAFAPAIAMAQPAPQPAPPARSEPAQPPGAEPPPPGQAPPEHYYVEPAQPGGGGPRPPPRGQVYEPPPPGYGPGPMLVYEPPPPPKPKHRSPKSALLVGARAGWFIPFGDLWGNCVFNASSGREECSIAKWQDYQSSGGMFQLDVGARIARRNMILFMWEHASLGRGSEAPGANGGQEFGVTDYYALGIRHSSDPNKVGFVSEIGIGYRTARARWRDGTELELTSFPLELRIGLGADFRLTEVFTLSPLITLGGGVFTDAEITGPNTDGLIGRTRDDQSGTHSWVTFQLAAHFDLFGSK